MAYVRYPRAAVAAVASIPAAGARAEALTQETGAERGSKSSVLWASAPLHTTGGRAVAVRRTAPLEVEVAWIRDGQTRIEWVPAQRVLTEKQVRRWVQNARFSED